MCNAISVTIGDQRFGSKTAARKYCKARLAAYLDGDTVSAEDFRFLNALLQRHPGESEKVGCGVKRFFRDEAPKPSYTDRCFWIERADGTMIDFSYIECLR